MQHRISRTFAGCLLALGMLAATAARADVVNGGFESGDFSGWTQTGDNSFNFVTMGTVGWPVQSGSYSASLGPWQDTGSISQSIATTAGDVYRVSFWLQNEADANGLTGDNSFEFSWDGVAQMTLTNQAAFGWTQYGFALTASGPSTELKFTFYNPSSFWDLDGVAVPEPGSLALAGLAIGLAAVQTRRRRSPVLSA